MLAHAPVERGFQGRVLAPHPPARQARHFGGVVGARGERLQHGHARHVEHVAGHAGQLDVGPPSGFGTRLRTAVRIPVSVRRWRTNSRRSRIAGGGTKPLVTRPWRTSCAIHSVSFTSVLRPGTVLMGWALPTIRSKCPSSTAYTGFQ